MQSTIKLTVFVVGLAVLSHSQGALAQSHGRPYSVHAGTQGLSLSQGAFEQGNCKDAKGDFREFWDGGDNSPGTLSNGGWLNGATLAVFNSIGYPTPIPTQFTYSAAFTLATRRGQLKGTRTFLTDVGTGWSVDMTIIDPNASTGMFAGATGVLYVYQIGSNPAPPPTTYESEVRGQVCFARGREPSDR